MSDHALGLLPREFAGARLRRLRQTDLQAFQAYRGNAELGRFQGWLPLSDADASQFLTEMAEAHLFAPGHWVQLGIAEAESDALIGDIGLYLSDDGCTGEVGFTLEPRSQGRAIASGAVAEAVHLLFSATSAARILGITDVRNEPSVRLLQRLRFRPLERRDVIFRGEACTEQVFVLQRPP